MSKPSLFLSMGEVTMKKVIGGILIAGWAITAIPLWLVEIPDKVFNDLYSGVGYALGNVCVLVLGIWLVRGKRKKVTNG